MQQQQVFPRGQPIGFTAGPFTDAFSNPVTPTGANLTLTYKVCGVKRTQSAALTQAAGPYWVYSWDSSVADAGEVAWFINATGVTAAVNQGEFWLDKNDANPGS